MKINSHLKTGYVEIEALCPEYDSPKQVCSAATSYWVLGLGQQMRYCVTRDYDNCPIYLGKALRLSRPKGLARDSIKDSGK